MIGPYVYIRTSSIKETQSHDNINKRKPHKKPAEIKSGCLLPACTGIFLGLYFVHEDGGDIFLRSIGISPNYTALQPIRLTSSGNLLLNIV
jgi:hypothetical protein